MRTLKSHAGSADDSPVQCHGASKLAVSRALLQGTMRDDTRTASTAKKMNPHPRYHEQETPLAALEAVDDLDIQVLDALGRRGYSLVCQLAVRAPGTFFHSTRVLELLQSAGFAEHPDEIAAVLVHDCGKLLQPKRYAENAAEDLGCPDPWVLAGHVDHGVLLIEDAMLGKTAMNAVMEHHGTQVVGKCGQRYGGRVPTSEFTAALMMADTLDAILSGGGDGLDLLRICVDRCTDGQFEMVGDEVAAVATRRLMASSLTR